MRRRLDQELVRQGFFLSTEDALRAVMAGEVSTADRRMERAGEQVREGIELHVRGRQAYVSRGGFKLAAGLDAFCVDPRGLACMDVGCSTGGFTDCLLRRGATSVVAVDVGYAQFDWSLRRDSRVQLFERTNICDLAQRSDVHDIDLAVCDVSFTSVLTVAPAIYEFVVDGGLFLTLVKPQFEARRDEVEEGGLVRSEKVRHRTLERVTQGLCALNFIVRDTCDSPIRGRKGNREFLLLAQKPEVPATLEQMSSVVEKGRVP